jgi:hypothetical protein
LPDREDSPVLRLALIAVLALSGCVTAPAFAAPPPAGWSGSLSDPAILCDARDQIVAIAAAGQANNIGALLKVLEYRRLINAAGEPTCAAAAIEGVTVMESEVIGVFYILPDERVRAWAVHIARGSMQAWILHIEPAGMPNRKFSI